MSGRKVRKARGIAQLLQAIAAACEKIADCVAHRAAGNCLARGMRSTSCHCHHAIMPSM
jgi:hypothetical protein